MKKTIIAFVVGFILASIPTVLGVTLTRTRFSDVLGNEWFSNHVNKLADLNLVAGYNDGTFKPGNSITRAEVATIVNKLIDSSNIIVEPFPIGTSTNIPGEGTFQICKSASDGSRIYTSMFPYLPFQGMYYDYQGNIIEETPQTRDCQITTREYFYSRVSTEQ